MTTAPWHHMRTATKERIVAERFAELHPTWTIHEEVKLPYRDTLRPGTEFKVEGEPGRVFRFIRYVETPEGCWVDAYGGTRDPRGERQLRSFRPERITRVLRKPVLKGTNHHTREA